MFHRFHRFVFRRLLSAHLAPHLWFFVNRDISHRLSILVDNGIFGHDHRVLVAINFNGRALNSVLMFVGLDLLNEYRRYQCWRPRLVRYAQ